MRLGLGLGISRTMALGGGTPALPTANLRGDYRGDALGTDASGTGNTLTLTGTSSGATLNGLATTRFNGTTDRADRAVFDLGAAGAITIVSVVNVLSVGSGQKTIVSYGDGAFDTHGIGHDAGIARSINGVVAGDGTTDLTAGWHVVITVQTDDPSTDRLYVDGAEEGSGASGVGAVADGLAFGIGRLVAATQYPNMDLARCLVYAENCDSDKRAAIFAALTAEYAL